MGIKITFVGNMSKYEKDDARCFINRNLSVNREESMKDNFVVVKVVDEAKLRDYLMAQLERGIHIYVYVPQKDYWKRCDAITSSSVGLFICC